MTEIKQLRQSIDARLAERPCDEAGRKTLRYEQMPLRRTVADRQLTAMTRMVEALGLALDPQQEAA